MTEQKGSSTRPNSELTPDQRVKTERGGRRLTDEAYNRRWFERLRARSITNENGCFVWQGPRSSKGYIMFVHRAWRCQAHRVVYRLTHAVELKTEEFVCHTCDERRCWNPAHLFIGSAKDNNNDCAGKGRHHNTVKTSCKRGHPYNESNTYITPEGLRNCKVCSRARMRIAAGWPEELAYSMDAVPHGQRPINANYRKTRKAA